MVVTNHTFDQMLDMIRVNDILGYKVTKNAGRAHNYLGVLKDRLRKKEKPNRASLFDFWSIAVFGLENAYVNGNKEDSSLPVFLSAFLGKKGIVVRIEDSGEGFDFEETQRKYMDEEKYFKNCGYGFRYYNKKECLVSFENKGATLNILYFFDPQDFTKIETLEEKL